jgi:hypothetical protein
MRRNEGAGNYRQLLGLEFPPTLSLSEELVQFGANVSWKCRQYTPSNNRDAQHLNAEIYRQHAAEPVFVNVNGAKESIPWNRFRQPTLPGGPVQPSRVVAPGWESIPVLLKRFTNAGSGNESLRRPHEALQCL